VAISSYPFDSQLTTETQYSQLFRELQDSGIVPTSETAWKVSADASGMSVKLQPGYAIVRGHAVLSTAIESVTIPNAEAQPRTDRIVLRLDPTLNSIVPAVVKGLAGGGLPALTQSPDGIFEMSVARIAVGQNVTNIGALDVTDDRQFSGSRIRHWTPDTRPEDPRLAQLGLNTSTNKWEFYNGSEWVDLQPVINWTTIEGKPPAFTATPHRHTWNDLDDVPTTYVPSPHAHAISQITDLQVKLDGKANASHAHGEYASAGGWHGAGYVSKGDWNNISLRYDGRLLWRVNGSEWDIPDKGWVLNNFPGYGSTVAWANGTKQCHAYQIGGPGPYYSVWVDGNGTFGRNTSSIRYKENVRDWRDIPTEDVLSLRPVVYDRKATPDPTTGEMREGNKDEFGLIAEEVAKTLPEVITYYDGQIDGIRYDMIAVALLRVVQDQEKRIAALEAKLP